MNAQIPPEKEASSGLEEVRAELDKREYYLRTLYDVSKDIFGSVDFKIILKNFLLMTMGNFGVTEGFVLIQNVPSAEITNLESMGYQERDLNTLCHSAKKILLHYYDRGSFENGLILTNARELPLGVACALPFSLDTECLGLLALGPKLIGETYREDDEELLVTLSNSLIISLRNAISYGKLEEAYENLKLLDKAKEKVINHLSHELKTPLALISGVFSKVSRELSKAHISGLEKTMNRGYRNINRLLDLQAKIEDILNQKSVEEKEKIITLIEDAAGFVEELTEGERTQNKESLKRIYERIESIFSIEDIHVEEIPLDEFLDNIYYEVMESIKGRNLNIIRNFEKGIFTTMDKNILKKVCSGLLKNAIENSPDEGKIEISAQCDGKKIQIDIHDCGVGITAQNQKMIFGGFFHTQDTEAYSSKRPYEFNAGGSGSDLLRVKSFSERYGFSVDFNSTRCKFIPNDIDMCPGRISDCRFIAEQSECFNSGGSTFSLKFPFAKDRGEG